MRATVAFASRFGTTEALATRVASGLKRSDVEADLLDVSSGRVPPEAPLVVMTAIIWEAPLPAMVDWLDRHGRIARRWAVGVGVVCAEAGVKKDGGGLGYARSFVKRVGNDRAFSFALSGRIPPRSELKRWESLALGTMAKVLGYSFAELRADEEGAMLAGETIGRILRDRAVPADVSGDA